MIFNALYILTGSLALSSAAPLVEPRATELTAASIEAIDPRTKVCNGNQQNPTECRTATQAVPHINKAFQQYQLTTPGEQAAALAWMLFEGAGFKYHHNLNPSNVGQGTRNQQSAKYNLEFAQALASSGQLQGDATKAEQASPANVLNMLYPDDFSFASAAWYISVHSQPCRQGLKAATLDGWHTFLTSCVGTTVADRDTLWNAAIAQLGH